MTDAKIVSSTLKSEKAENCVLKTIRAIRFPQPEGGGVVDVDYPFPFAPAHKIIDLN